MGTKLQMTPFQRYLVLLIFRNITRQSQIFLQIFLTSINFFVHILFNMYILHWILRKKSNLEPLIQLKFFCMYANGHILFFKKTLWYCNVFVIL